METTTNIIGMAHTVDLSQPDGSRTTSDESLQQEVRTAKDSLLGPKVKTRIGAWNVCTMYETSKSAQVISEMRRYRLDILRVNECRWTGSSHLVTSDG